MAGARRRMANLQRCPAKPAGLTRATPVSPPIVSIVISRPAGRGQQAFRGRQSYPQVGEATRVRVPQSSRILVSKGLLRHKIISFTTVAAARAGCQLVRLGLAWLGSFLLVNKMSKQYSSLSQRTRCMPLQHMKNTWQYSHSKSFKTYKIHYICTLLNHN